MLQYVVEVKRRGQSGPAAPGAPPPCGCPLGAAGAAPGAAVVGAGAAAKSPGAAAGGTRAGRAAVGGVEYAVGGWGGYEISRRRERWEARSGGDERPGGRYVGRTYVHAGDAVRSVMGGAREAVGGARGRDTPLRKAALRLAGTLGRLEDRLCDADADGVWECGSPAAPYALTVPPLTSADLRAFADDPEQQDDPDALEDLGEDVLAVADAAGAREGAALPPMPSLARRGRPPLPARAVPVSDDEAVLRLEAAVAPYVASVERLQAALATRLDAAAALLDAALVR